MFVQYQDKLLFINFKIYPMILVIVQLTRKFVQYFNIRIIKVLQICHLQNNIARSVKNKVKLFYQTNLEYVHQ